jgi:hypothetical protein
MRHSAREGSGHYKDKVIEAALEADAPWRRHTDTSAPAPTTREASIVQATVQDSGLDITQACASSNQSSPLASNGHGTDLEAILRWFCQAFFLF